MCVCVREDFHNPILLSSFMTYHQICNKSNTTGVTILTFPDHLSSPSVFSEVRVIHSLVSFLVFCQQLFDLLSLFLLAITLSVLPASDYPPLIS